MGVPVNEMHDNTPPFVKAMARALAAEAEVERLRAELETERQRLAACGVAALGWFKDCLPEYESASLSDVLKLRERVANLETENTELRDKLSILEEQGADMRQTLLKQAENVVESFTANRALRKETAELRLSEKMKVECIADLEMAARRRMAKLEWFEKENEELRMRIEGIRVALTEHQRAIVQQHLNALDNPKPLEGT